MTTRAMLVDVQARLGEHKAVDGMVLLEAVSLNM